MFPALYHRHHSEYTEDLPFWLELAAHSSGPILELGCGTGRVLLPLARAGHTVYGLDSDIEMLRFAAHQITQETRPLIHLFQADMSRFRTAVQFGLIILPCNTLSALTRPVLSKTLACARQHLTSGGVFAASFPNPRLLAQMPKQGAEEVEEVFLHPEDDEPVQVSSAWEHDEEYFQVHWYYDHLLPDGRVERLEAGVKHHILPLNAYLEVFQAAGFTRLQTYGTFTYLRYRKNSPHLIIVAS